MRNLISSSEARPAELTSGNQFMLKAITKSLCRKLRKLVQLKANDEYIENLKQWALSELKATSYQTQGPFFKFYPELVS
jgi:hypothetical protein